jgi:hypothetical protein
LSITVYALNALWIDHRIFYGDPVVTGGVLATSSPQVQNDCGGQSRISANFHEWHFVAKRREAPFFSLLYLANLLI